MTVKELIKRLEQMPKEATVEIWVNTPNSSYSCSSYTQDDIDVYEYKGIVYVEGTEY